MRCGRNRIIQIGRKRRHEVIQTSNALSNPGMKPLPTSQATASRDRFVARQLSSTCSLSRVLSVVNSCSAVSMELWHLKYQTMMMHLAWVALYVCSDFMSTMDMNTSKCTWLSTSLGRMPASTPNRSWEQLTLSP